MLFLRSAGRYTTGWPRFSTQMKCRKSYAIESQDATDRKVTAEYGQPTPCSHPHLLKQDELVPGLKLSEFVSRREKLADSIAASNSRATHIVVVPSAEIQYMSDRIPYFFRQNTDFRYLTGCLEPDCVLVLVVGPSSGAAFKSIMFVRQNSQHSRLWEGPRTGASNAPEMFGVDEAHLLSDMTGYIASVLRSAGADSVVWYDYRNPAHQQLHHTAMTSIMKGVAANTTIQCPRQAIHKLRWIKSAGEQALMRKAGDIASRAIQESMAATGSGKAKTEHQLYAIVDYSCRMGGAQFLAYPPVVATGNNANIIHYINNNQRLQPGELVLMDAGCEADGYCSDITRTWPVDRRFSDIQLTLYQIVESVQLELLESCRNSLPTLDQMFTLMTKSLGKKLVEAKVLSQQAKTMDIKEVVFKLCPHHVSHYLGMDVHDTGTLARDIHLQSGVCFTVEPGIYVEANCPLTKPEFRGCGIRIEDDVLITDSGPEILSRNCPKTITEIQHSIESL